MGGLVLDRKEALALLHEYTKSESLIRHGYCVEASMRWYARHFKHSESEVDRWGITGLLHDFDYEMYPDCSPPDGHPYAGSRILQQLGYPEDIRQATLGHCTSSGVARDTQMAKTLFAVDELSGFIYAASLVRPDKPLQNVEVKSVLKKMKDKAFAKGCNRDDMTLGAAELGLSMEDHVTNTLLALKESEARIIALD